MKTTRARDWLNERFVGTKRMGGLVKCTYCKRFLSRSQATVDHAKPTSKGGEDRRHNYRISCVKCNVRKGSMEENEFRALIAAKTRRVVSVTNLAT